VVVQQLMTLRRKAMDDDDIQEYVSNNFAQTFKQVVRNETLEEVAREFEKMKVFEADTMASIAINIRSMKRNAKT
jgi:hypothetical protein